MNRIDKKFKELKKKKQKAFIAFITAGYPNLNITEKLVLSMDKSGIDIIELGVPFSDPMADGALIQEASTYALTKNTHLIDVLKLVKRLRLKTKLPLILMTYYNVIFSFPEERFLKEAARCGVDGVIIPDLPPEEARSPIKEAKKNKINIIFFISPTTSAKRIKYIANLSGGFIYYVSLTGVTGPRKKLPSDLKNHINSIKKSTKKPVCVGFGISNPKQVKTISKIADGVIVGSSIIREIKKNIKKSNLVSLTTKFVSKLNSNPPR